MQNDSPCRAIAPRGSLARSNRCIAVRKVCIAALQVCFAVADLLPRGTGRIDSVNGFYYILIHNCFLNVCRRPYTIITCSNRSFNWRSLCFQYSLEYRLGYLKLPANVGILVPLHWS